MTGTRLHHARARARARAYALALVALLGLVAGLGVTIILERQGQAQRAVQRGVDSYLHHHQQAGLRDIIGMGLRFGGINANDIKPSAVAKMVLRVEGSGEVEISVADGQGALLVTDGPGTAQVLRAALEQLRTDHPAVWNQPRFVRTRGPAKVSANSAPREVLVALFKAVDKDGPADAFAAKLIERREERRLVQRDVGELLTTAGADEQVRQIIDGLVTADPTVFRCRIESRGTGGGGASRAVARFEAMIQGDPKGGSSTAGWAFLTWTPLEPGSEWSKDEAFDKASP